MTTSFRFRPSSKTQSASKSPPRQPAGDKRKGSYVNIINTHRQGAGAQADYEKDEVSIQLALLAHFPQARGNNTVGDEELYGEKLRQPHVFRMETTLVGGLSGDYIAAVEAPFSSRPVMLEIADPVSFEADEIETPWPLVWTASGAQGHPDGRLG